MSHATIWWILTGSLVIAELLTGTFYLLMLAIGAAAGAMAGHMGLGVSAQMTIAAIVAATLMPAWHIYRRRQPKPDPQDVLRSMHMDIGGVVQIDEWQPDGSASVKYRGAQWNAVLRPGQAAVAGLYRIAEMEGSSLVVAVAEPQEQATESV